LRWYKELFSTSEFLVSFGQSLLLAVTTTIVSLTIGVLAALALTRYSFRGRLLIQALILSPIMIPGVAFGVGLAQFFGALRVSGGFLPLLTGHVIIATPFVVRTVSASVQTLDRNAERAAISLGASPMRVFREITLPMLRPGLVAGGLFAFVMSFGELAISLFVAGLYVVPLPVRIFTYLQTVLEPTVAAASTFLVLVSVLVLVAIERLVGLHHVLGQTGRRNYSSV
jgi:putative spermidine/putrescine transport system permease protein